ncbi:hypothetical protein Nepgr_010336 [Nepenthes gracilis]|uniref:Fatty acyl-CoA reductase n=1 Tax=Nepenthes gracilis TaxID=150966 RepID=A0AAD3SCY9_NEPGR|nr:hypothetical protein Nepgr_010336 [Nepenthes gracilis]
MGADFTSFISNKVAVAPGDVSCEDLAIQDANLKEEMWREIDVIVNLAATTRFDERYDISLNINTFGAKYVLDFAKKCSHIKTLVQVSTAYVSGERIGLLLEEPYHVGATLLGLDIEEEKRLLHQKLDQLHAVAATDDSIKLAMKDLGIQRARKYGWPNVYVFTKALGEMILLQSNDDIPLVIIRPTIITSTYKEPFPGWIEGFRTLDSVIAAYGKGRLTHMPCDTETILDLIPADMVVNAIITAMVAHANQHSVDTMIYGVGSSMKNPPKITLIANLAYRYFTKHPIINGEGNPIIVSKPKPLSSMASFRRYIAMHYLLPLKVLELTNIAFCQRFRGTYMKLRKKFDSLMRYIDIYLPYLFFKGIYDDINTEKLWAAAREGGVETDVFYFDPKVIDWEDYLMNTHFSGVVKYALR